MGSSSSKDSSVVPVRPSPSDPPHATTGLGQYPRLPNGNYKVLDTEVTPEVADAYKDNAELLKYRAVFPAHCHTPFDAVRLCMLQKLDRDTCTEVYAAFKPCAQEMALRRAATVRKRDEAERQQRLQEAAERRKKQEVST